MTLSDDIRAYAMLPTRTLQRGRDSMMRLEHVLCESFLTGIDWDEHALWSIEWRTFALIVASALDDSCTFKYCPRSTSGVPGAGKTVDGGM